MDKIDKNVQTREAVRQTFIIGADYLDKLKDFVHTKRRSGQYEYCQKDAIQEALDLLFASIKIIKRPETIRQRERNRSMRIKEAKK